MRKANLKANSGVQLLCSYSYDGILSIQCIDRHHHCLRCLQQHLVMITSQQPPASKHHRIRLTLCSIQKWVQQGITAWMPAVIINASVKNAYLHQQQATKLITMSPGSTCYAAMSCKPAYAVLFQSPTIPPACQLNFRIKYLACPSYMHVHAICQKMQSMHSILKHKAL